MIGRTLITSLPARRSGTVVGRSPIAAKSKQLVPPALFSAKHRNGRTLISSLPARSRTVLGRSTITAATAKSKQLVVPPALLSSALHRNTSYNRTTTAVHHSPTSYGIQRWHSSAAHTTVPKSVPSNKSEPPPTIPTAFHPTSERKYQFFQNVELTSDNIAIIRFDNPAKKVNTISFALQTEFEAVWDAEIHSNDSVKAVVFASGKPNGFIAGADIFDIQSKENKEDIIPFIESATNFFVHRMKSGRDLPLVCAIHGPALGGGLEWALWCDYRICTDSPKTKLGLPEVKLGLLPGLGGTQNLHKLVGLQKAMDMMLTGKDIRPDRAKKMGLVDLVVAPQSLEKVAIDIAKGLANKTIKKSVGKSNKKSLMDKVVEGTPFGRNMMWKKSTRWCKRIRMENIQLHLQLLIL